jgi:hypothetical protein
MAAPPSALMALEKAYDKSYSEGGEPPDSTVAAALAGALRDAHPPFVSDDPEVLRFMALCFNLVDDSVRSAQWYLLAFLAGGSPELDAAIGSWNRLATDLLSMTLHEHFVEHGDEYGLTLLLAKIRETVRERAQSPP